VVEGDEDCVVHKGDSLCNGAVVYLVAISSNSNGAFFLAIYV
jgi:hypothetical protein